MKKEKDNPKADEFDNNSEKHSGPNRKKRTLGVDPDKRNQLMIKQLNEFLSSPERVRKLFEQLSYKEITKN